MKSHGSQYFIWPIHCGKYLPKTYDFFQVLLNSLLVMKKLIELKKLRFYAYTFSIYFPFSLKSKFILLEQKLNICLTVHGCIHVMHTHALALDFSARHTARILVKYISGLSLGKLKISSINLPLTNQHAGF